MDLKAFLVSHPGFRVAGAGDGEALLRFFNKSPMEGKALSLRYERDPDFFAFLRMQSASAFVLAGESSKNREIAAIGTLSVRPGMIAGAERTVGYLGDLRLGSDRRLTVQWRKLYGELLEASSRIDELGGCEHFLTAVIDENKAALLALTRRSDSPYLYRELARYRMVNVLGRAPWARRDAGFRVERGRAETAYELIDFLDRENRGKAFGFRFGTELPRRLATWPGLSYGSFFIARSRAVSGAGAGEILGCFAPWSPSPAKRIVVQKMPPLLHGACFAMKLLRGQAPGPGRELKAKYLTHLEIKRSMHARERQEVLRALLSEAYESGVFSDVHLAAFADFEQAPLATGLKGYFVQRTPMTLYQVLPRAKASSPDLLRLGELPPAFEMALV